MNSNDSVEETPKTIRTRPGRLANIWITLVSVLMIAVLLFVMEVWFGHVVGVEFEPNQFQVRSFQYYEIPWIQIQLTPIRRTVSSPETARYLTQNSLLGPAGKPRWDLVSVARSRGNPRFADAALLTDQLELERQGQAVWKKWSQDHPKLAAILWPRVASLARRELYLLIPDILWHMRSWDDPATASAWIDTYLQTELVDLVVDMRAAGREQLANELLAEALVDYPDHEPLLSLRE
ncbi:MAG: hypothetical protein AAF670_12655 [Planctomycetota bacterium]